MEQPLLTTYSVAAPRGVVLMLHGGKEHSRQAVTGRSASWRRSLVMQRALARPLREQGLAVWLVRFRERGWNGGPGPVTDARWALARVRETYDDLPVTLLGHSMGARTAVRVADDPSVVGVVALAPWFPPGEPIAALTDRHLVAAHGRADRITSFAATADFVARASTVASSAELVDMGGLGHYMLRDAGAWNRIALDSCLMLHAAR